MGNMLSFCGKGWENVNTLNAFPSAPCCSARLGLHRGHGGGAEAAGPPPPGPAGAGMSAAPRWLPAGRTPPFNAASPPTDCWPCSYHLLQHQDPRWCSHAQTIPGDAGSHDGLSVEQRAAENRMQRETQWRSRFHKWTSGLWEDFIREFLMSEMVPFSRFP